MWARKFRNDQEGLPAAPAPGPPKDHDARFDNLFETQEGAALLETAEQQPHRAGDILCSRLFYMPSEFPSFWGYPWARGTSSSAVPVPGGPGTLPVAVAVTAVNVRFARVKRLRCAHRPPSSWLPDKEKPGSLL